MILAANPTHASHFPCRSQPHHSAGERRSRGQFPQRALALHRAARMSHRRAAVSPANAITVTKVVKSPMPSPTVSGQKSAADGRNPEREISGAIYPAASGTGSRAKSQDAISIMALADRRGTLPPFHCAGRFRGASPLRQERATHRCRWRRKSDTLTPHWPL